MSQSEDEIKDEHVSDSPAKVATLWQKFHFSGRVIMCSVLFGMGLVLIGGLIFAINVNDDTKKNAKNEEITDQMPTKAPSNYVGPVVMGIGGFIVTVGVIMCLFETQVCRKKTADSKPLISDKNEDVEAKFSDSTQIPSSSHCQKNHKHKSRKASSSPRKTKNKHTKAHSHEQNRVSTKSPPMSIDKSKNFMTSSEESFLTPPNTLSEKGALEHMDSREAEIQTPSSLMKSFTSSGTWNQSTEFLTPAASYKENSVSVESSVELDEKQALVNIKTNEVSAMECIRPEYMTPMKSEEEKIQEMFIQVKQEQMKVDVKQSEGKIAQKDEQSLDFQFDTSAVKETTDKPVNKANPDAFEKGKTINEENTISDNFLSDSNVSAETFIDDKENASFESSEIIANAHKNEKEDDNKGIPSSHGTSIEKIAPCLSHDSSTSHFNEDENVSELESEPSNVKINENNEQLDLEGSTSSEETLVSRDTSIEKPKIIDTQIVLSMAEENSDVKSKISDTSESPKADQSSSNHSSSDQQNSLVDSLKAEKVGESDLNVKENDSKNTDEKSS